VIYGKVSKNVFSGYYTIKEMVQTVNLALKGSVGALPTYPTNFMAGAIGAAVDSLDRGSPQGANPLITIANHDQCYHVLRNACLHSELVRIQYRPPF
jgi:hypothetical protein